MIDRGGFMGWLRKYACVAAKDYPLFSAGALRIIIDYAGVLGIKPSLNDPEFTRLATVLWRLLKQLNTEGYIVLTGVNNSIDLYHAVVNIPREVLNCGGV